MTKGKGSGKTALRNAYRGKDHRERSQLKTRRHLGLLEKKKDYKLRASAFRKSKRHAQILREQARQRNPDEYHTDMHHIALDDSGRHVRKARSKKGKEQKKENAENARYLMYKSSVDAGRIAQLKKDLSFSHVTPQNKHTVFVDSEQDKEDFDAAEYFDTLPELVSDPSLRATKARVSTVELAPPTAKQVKRTVRRYQELADRITRKQRIDSLVRKVQVEQSLLTRKGARRIVKKATDTEAAQYKWDYERKR
eukprot:TRINITY_DN12235_c1_g1_i1.p1 TRINITY_DN12235_c1_g1~~TRINITY_DN12235_c1_g1_i1.p1  ORF type:complete len:252 (+),score=68.33 TRINITY_DN12235_c1_g1_i1:76-831(+)